MYHYLRFNIQQLFRFVMFSSWLVLFPLTTWGKNSDTARSLVRQAADAAVKKDYRRSSDLLLRARTEAERVTDYEQLFWVYTNLGINQAELLNYADALQNFTQAYQIATQHLDKRKVLSIRNNIAGLYMMNGEKAKALSEYQHIYHDLKRGKDNVFIGGCALNIATLLIDDRQCKKALPFIEEAERLLGRDVENKPSLVALRMDYLLQMGRAEVAYDLVKGVQQKYPDLSVHPDLLLCQARTAQATGRADEAVAAAQRILLTKGGVDLSMKRSVFELLASAYTLLNDFPQALACKDSVVRTADKLSNVTGQKLFEARQIQFDIWQKQQEIDSYRSQHRLELALMLVAVVACAILVWALWVQKRNSRQQRRLSALELEREQERRELLQHRLADEQAEQQASQRTIEQRSRELMSKALQAANRTDALRDLIHALEANDVFSKTNDAALKRTLSALRHQLDASVEWKDFTTYFEQSNALFIETLKARHPDLSPSDIRFLSLLYINLSSKEIALLLNITPEYCKKKRQRMARKLGLTDSRELYKYLTGL